MLITHVPKDNRVGISSMWVGWGGVRETIYFNAPLLFVPHSPFGPPPTCYPPVLSFMGAPLHMLFLNHIPLKCIRLQYPTNPLDADNNNDRWIKRQPAKDTGWGRKRLRKRESLLLLLMVSCHSSGAGAVSIPIYIPRSTICGTFMGTFCGREI